MVITKYQRLDEEERLILVLGSPGWEILGHGNQDPNCGKDFMEESQTDACRRKVGRGRDVRGQVPLDSFSQNHMNHFFLGGGSL